MDTALRIYGLLEEGENVTGLVLCPVMGFESENAGDTGTHRRVT